MMHSYQSLDEPCPWPINEERDLERMKARHLRLLVAAIERDADRKSAADEAVMTDQPALPPGLRRPV